MIILFCSEKLSHHTSFYRLKGLKKLLITAGQEEGLHLQTKHNMFVHPADQTTFLKDDRSRFQFDSEDEPSGKPGVRYSKCFLFFY